MSDARSRNVLLAGVLAAAGVVFCFADVFIRPWLSPSYRPSPPAGWVMALAAAAALLAVTAAMVWPRWQAGLVRVLAVTAFIYLVYRPLTVPWCLGLARLPLTPAAQYWLVRGPGNGALGLLPSAVAVLLGGWCLFGVSIREQWNGRLWPAVRDLAYGVGAAAVLSVVFLGMAAAAGKGRVAWEPNWAGHGVNLFSNLYEEVLARGLLLQVTRRAGGNWFGIAWTALVFGSMHSGWLALGVATTAWILAWVVLRAGSLWAGYALHQGLDLFMDSLLH